MYVFKNSEMDLISSMFQKAITKFTLTKVLEVFRYNFPMKQGRYIFTAMAIQTLNSSSFLSNNECLKKFIIKYGWEGRQ